MPRRSSLTVRLVVVTCVLVTVAVVGVLALEQWLGDPWLAGAIALAALVPLAISAVRWPLGPVTAMFRALAGTVTPEGLAQAAAELPDGGGWR